MGNMVPVASLPAVQRDLFLARCLRRVEDAPTQVDSLRVGWKDMVIAFSTDATTSTASVEVSERISLVTFTSRLESLLDCGATSEGAAEWILKFSCRISEYGSAEQVRRLLCDKVASVDGRTGETIGVMKIQRRSVTAGHAKIRIVPADDSLQLVVRHQTAQGLKAVWKSVLWRLRPQHGPAGAASRKANPEVKNAAVVVTAPAIVVRADTYNWRDAAATISKLGGSLEIETARKDGVAVVLPLEAKNFQGFGEWSTGYSTPYWTDASYGQYEAEVQIARLPPGMPEGVVLTETGGVSVYSKKYSEFRERALALAKWLDLPWQLPPVPAGSNELLPKK